MTAPPVKVVVAGGGTAGWIAATALVRLLRRLVDVTLVESEEIGTVGVGEATIPTARAFHDYLRIDERAFMAATGATFKLGIAFENWAQTGDRYMHSFGTIGMSNWMADFQHFWLQARAQGNANGIGSYCLEHEAAEAGKFAHQQQSPLNYAYHLDAGRYAAFLRRIAETDGVTRIEGRIDRIEQDGESGDIAALHLADGRVVTGDLFIDCTGFRGLLIEETLHAGYDDWRHWLATDSAIAVQTQAIAPPMPYTRSIAHDAGWQWRIPLQHRMGNGIVFASGFCDEETGRRRLLESVEGEVLTEPRLIRYVTGRRRKSWHRNCVALGLSSGFVEPLESTSIHLIMSGITRLIQQFPFGGIEDVHRNRFNTMVERELESIRDFIILHYKLTERSDSDFWKSRAALAIPHSLSDRIEAFATSAQAWQAPDELFRVDSWLQVMLGQRLEPKHWHGVASLMSEGRLRDSLLDADVRIKQQLAQLPLHGEYVSRYCAEGA